MLAESLVLISILSALATVLTTLHRRAVRIDRERAARARSLTRRELERLVNTVRMLARG